MVPASSIWRPSDGGPREERPTPVALEVEEANRSCIGVACSLATREGQVIFAPGPRGLMIPKDRLEAIMICIRFSRHVNEAGSTGFSGRRGPVLAIERLYHRTGQLVIVTLGKERLPAMPTGMRQMVSNRSRVDTVGAGDSFSVGAFVSARLEGLDMTQPLGPLLTKSLSQIVRVRAFIWLGKEQQELPEQNWKRK